MTMSRMLGKAPSLARTRKPLCMLLRECCKIQQGGCVSNSIPSLERAAHMTIAVYVGDSASLSYLQLIRMIVESISGQSAFTLDPSRHKIMENTINLPNGIRTPHILPDRETANILVESYFTNVGVLASKARKSMAD
jgi:hypothetical protein